MKYLIFFLLLVSCCKEEDSNMYVCTKSYVKYSHTALWQYGIQWKIDYYGSEKQMKVFEQLHSQNDTLIDGEGYPTVFDYECNCKLK